MHILDISNPSAPVPVGQIDVGGLANKIETSGALMYVYGLFNGHYGLRLLDASTPESPVVINTIPLQYMNPGHFDVLADGKFAVVSNGTYIYDPMVCEAPHP